MRSSRRAHTRGPNATLGHLAELEGARWLREEQGHRVGAIPDHFGDVPAQDHPDLVYLADVATERAGTIVEKGTYVDVKAAALRVTDGASTRLGRFQVRQRAHEWLCERAGEYLLVLYDRAALVWENDDPQRCERWTGHRLVPARTVDAVIETWTPDRQAADDVARVPWSRLIDPTEVDDGE